MNEFYVERMEVGSGTSSNSSSSSSNGSINGLKCGKKSYFEDVKGSSPTESRRPSTATAAKKGKGVVVQGEQGPRCQVEGCGVDLRDAKSYYSRHKVCGKHSKSPQVTVAGVQQRFCQQCSRFHLLPEFDQGKRSCRRRLAGHNERRRKPPPGTLFGPCGSLSSLFHAERTSKAGSFMLDFSTQPVSSGRGSRPMVRTLDNPQAVMEKFPSHLWHRSPETSSEILVQGSSARTSYFGPEIHSGECLVGVTDSSRALSLLSSQAWDSRDQSSSLGINGIVNDQGVSMVQSSGCQNETIDGFPGASWGFKARECSVTLQQRSTDLALTQTSQPVSSHYYGDLGVAQQSGREHLVNENSIGYDSSTPNMLL